MACFIPICRHLSPFFSVPLVLLCAEPSLPESIYRESICHISSLACAAECSLCQRTDNLTFPWSALQNRNRVPRLPPCVVCSALHYFWSERFVPQNPVKDRDTCHFSLRCLAEKFLFSKSTGLRLWPLSELTRNVSVLYHSLVETRHCHVRRVSKAFPEMQEAIPIKQLWNQIPETRWIKMTLFPAVCLLYFFKYLRKKSFE